MESRERTLQRRQTISRRFFVSAVCALWRLYVGGLVPAELLLLGFQPAYSCHPHAWNRDWQLFLVVPKEQAMPYEIPSAETIGAATFADCGENKSHLKVFRVNAGFRCWKPLNTPRTCFITQKCSRLRPPWTPRRRSSLSPRTIWVKWAKRSLMICCWLCNLAAQPRSKSFAPDAVHRAPTSASLISND